MNMHVRPCALALAVALAVNGCSGVGSLVPLPSAASAVASELDVSSLLSDEPITTSFADVDQRIVLPDTFGSGPYRPLTSLPRSPRGGFFLNEPGFFELDARSYCLRAGTRGPRTGGPGYLHASLAGSRAGIVRTILQRTVARPDIPQQDVQLLIWAVLAKASFTDLSPRLKVVAGQLLSPADVARLQTGSLRELSVTALNRASGQLPAAARRVLEAENALRRLLTAPTLDYAAAEQIAVLTGIDLPNEEGPSVPLGRWSAHPDGYFVRYLPSSYSRTRIQLYVPASLVAGETPGGGGYAAVEYDPSSGVATPASGGSQRLGVSGQPSGDGGQGPDVAGGAGGAGAGSRGGAGDGPPRSSHGGDVKPEKKEFQNCADAKRYFESTARTGQARWTLDLDPSSQITAVPKGGGYEASAPVRYVVNGKEIDVPDWSWPNMTAAERAALREFRDALFGHEEGHLQIADDFARSESGRTITATGRTPAEARANLLKALEAELVKKRADLQTGQNEYDVTTDHGAQQSRGGDPGIPGGKDVVFNCP